MMSFRVLISGCESGLTTKRSKKPVQKPQIPSHALFLGQLVSGIRKLLFLSHSGTNLSSWSMAQKWGNCTGFGRGHQMLTYDEQLSVFSRIQNGRGRHLPKARSFIRNVPSEPGRHCRAIGRK
jgi:hypothetical protein